MTTTATENWTVIRNERGLSIAGTRITLYAIMDYVMAGQSAEFIRDEYDLTDEQIKDVMEYIHTHRAQVEHEYDMVVRHDEKLRQHYEDLNRDRLAEISRLPPPPGREDLWARLQEWKARLHADR